MIARIFRITVITSFSLLAQQKEEKRDPPGASKNLNVLSPDVNILRVMQSFTAGLGVQCTYCHVQGNFASDENPKKETARKMLRLIKQINIHFADAGNDFANSRYLPYPEGKQYVTCYTCHQGQTRPPSQAPAPLKRAPEPYAPGQQGIGVPEAAPPPPGKSGKQ
jgi:Photosynthetic reaction centre cytochrome C subunit